MQDIINRFVSYVTIDTESDPNSNTTPSTAKQWDLAVITSYSIHYTKLYDML